MPRLLLALSFSLLAVGSAHQAVATPIVQHYQVSPGHLVQRCGGFSGGCSLESIEGTISFQIDLASGSAEIADSDLTVGGETLPFMNFADLSDLVGTTDATTLVFTNPPGSIASSWTFSPIGSNPGDILFWSGSYQDGCCDLFSYTFLEPASLTLVPEPSTGLLLAAGLTAISIARPRSKEPIA